MKQSNGDTHITTTADIVYNYPHLVSAKDISEKMAPTHINDKTENSITKMTVSKVIG